MSFWSKLGKGAMIGGAGLATAMTGGAAAPALAKALQIASSASPILGALAEGRAKGQQTDAAFKNNALQQEFANKLALDREMAARPDMRASQAARGDVMANVQDFSANRNSRIPGGNSTGGLRPSLFGPNTRSAGQTLSNIGASSIGNETGLPTPPAAAEGMPKSNFLDSLLSVAGPATSLLGALHNTTGAPQPTSTSTLPRKPSPLIPPSPSPWDKVNFRPQRPSLLLPPTSPSPWDNVGFR